MAEKERAGKLRCALSLLMRTESPNSRKEV
jgi:hypothetical protein